MRKLFLNLSSIVLLAASPVLAPVLAQSAPSAVANWNAGARVSDTAGGDVGAIAKVDGDFVVLKTDKHEVRLPKSSFTPHDGGFVMAMTQAQVNQAVEQTLAQAGEKITVGASVTGSQGGDVGIIDVIDGDGVIIKLASGKLVRLPRTALAPGPSGAVIGMTVAELEAAAQQSAGAAESADPEAGSDKNGG